MFGPPGKSELQKIYEESLRRDPPQERFLEAQNQSDALNLAASAAQIDVPKVEREAVVALVVRHSRERPLEFLLTLRSDQLKEHASQVALPGGMIELDERGDHRRALDREVAEEVGIPEGQVSWVEGHWDILPSIYGIRVFPYLGFLDGDRNPGTLRLQVEEVAAADWIALERLFDRSLWSRRELSRAPWEWRGWDHVAWGLTAAFLALFVKRITGQLPS